MSIDIPAPIIEEEEEQQREQGWELEAVQFVPLGHAMNMLLDEKYEDEGDYLVHARAAALYIGKHPKLVMDYRDLLTAAGREMAQTLVEKIEQHVSSHIVSVELDLKETYDEAAKKVNTIKGIKRESLLDAIMKNFTISEEQLTELANEIFNLTNFSGVAFGQGTTTENSTGSLLQIYIFNF